MFKARKEARKTSLFSFSLILKVNKLLGARCLSPSQNGLGSPKVQPYTLDPHVLQSLAVGSKQPRGTRSILELVAIQLCPGHADGVAHEPFFSQFLNFPYSLSFQHFYKRGRNRELARYSNHSLSRILKGTEAFRSFNNTRITSESTHSSARKGATSRAMMMWFDLTKRKTVRAFYSVLRKTSMMIT